MLPKAFKISKNECIPPVYHLCITCISRPQNNVNYLLFMNFLTILLSFQYIKKSPRNSTFPGLLNILYYLRNSRLANTLSKHCIYYLLKSGNISTCHIVCLSTNCCIVSLSSIADVSVDCLHDALELSVNLFECP